MTRREFLERLGGFTLMTAPALTTTLDGADYARAGFVDYSYDYATVTWNFSHGDCWLTIDSSGAPAESKDIPNVEVLRASAIKGDES